MGAALGISTLVIGVVGIIGYAVYASHKHELARTEQFRKIAADMGLEFSANEAGSVQSDVQELRLFNQGRNRRFSNMLMGNANGVDLAMFEYRYTTGSGKNQATHRQSVIYFRCPELELAEFDLRPENFFHKIGQAFGYKDIDFDSHALFSKKYLLRGPDEAAVRQLFTPDRLSFFEEMQNVCVEATRDRLVFYRQGKRGKPEALRALMTDGFRVYKLFGG